MLQRDLVIFVNFSWSLIETYVANNSCFYYQQLTHEVVGLVPNAHPHVDLRC